MNKKKLVLGFGIIFILVLFFQLTYAASLSVECKNTKYPYSLVSEMSTLLAQTCGEDYQLYRDAKASCLNDLGFSEEFGELSENGETCAINVDNCIADEYANYRSCDDECYNNYYGEITSADSLEEQKRWSNIYNGCLSDCRDVLAENKESCCGCYYEYRESYYITYKDLYECTAEELQCIILFPEVEGEEIGEDGEEKEQFTEYDCQDTGNEATGAAFLDITGNVVGGGLKGATGYVSYSGPSINTGFNKAWKWIKETGEGLCYLAGHPIASGKEWALRDSEFVGDFEGFLERQITEKEMQYLTQHFSNDEIGQIWKMLKQKDQFIKDIFKQDEYLPGRGTVVQLPSRNEYINLKNEAARRVAKENK